MPTLDNTRRIIGNNIVPSYITDDNEEETIQSMSLMSFQSNTTINTGKLNGGSDKINLDFKARFIMITIYNSNTQKVYFITDDMEVVQSDMKQIIKDGAERNIIITDNGFSYDIMEGTGYYFAIG